MDKKPLNEVENEIYTKRKTVRYDIRDITVEMINNKYKDLESEDIDFDEKYTNYIYVPDYQRDFTWDKDRQSKLIESIILGLPIPFIFVAENKNSSWEIVDGSQRIRTICSFIRGELILSNLNSLSSLNGYGFSDLEITRQGKILNTALRVIVLSEETTDEVKKDMFERINRGSDLLKPMEKRKGIYQGLFTTFLYKVCNDYSLFKELCPIDKWLQNRQEHEELMLRFFALSDTKIYEKGISTGISTFLDEYIQKKNIDFEKLSSEERENQQNIYKKRIETVCEYVSRVFPFGFNYRKANQTKRSVFEAISIGVYNAIEDGSISLNIDKEFIIDKLQSKEFEKFTKVAYQLHGKTKLQGRINYIYNLVRTNDNNKK